MASRAILQRKRDLFTSLIQSQCFVRSIWHPDQGASPQITAPWNFINATCNQCGDTDWKKGGSSNSLSKEVLMFTEMKYLGTNAFRIPTFVCGTERRGHAPSLGARRILESSRYFSITTQGQPAVGNATDQNEQQSVKQMKEASPEDCDQAVEGLSSVKAKSKAKQLHEFPRDSKSVIEILRAKLLRIGRAFSVAASMSREDWTVKLRHWKDDFKSTMQHYWLGIKLLWADARISSRLLLKLASGKNLSRRERQQLTRTTADIFRKL